MTRFRVVVVALILGILVAPAVVSADPAVTASAAGEQQAEWAFSNPSDYGLVNATIGASGASLAWLSRTFADTTAADFGLALARSNVDVTASPGDVLIADTSRLGPPLSTAFQPGPASMVDTYIATGSFANTNFGANDTLKLGFTSKSNWSRAILQFPTFPIPANATLLTVDLFLYLYASDRANSMSVSVHAITNNWTEYGSTWGVRDGVLDWTAAGGDFNPTDLDLVPAVGTVPGWYTWDVTRAAVDWWTGRAPNYGLLVRQADDGASVIRGHKMFWSSDAANASARPFLTITYAMPSSLGALESRVFDTGSGGAWETITWTATVPSGTGIEVRTRSGASPAPDGSWSAWSAAYLGPGRPIASPPARYIEYRVQLFTSNTLSPSLHDLTIGYGQFATLGRVLTASLDPVGLLGWGRLQANWSGPPGASVSFAYSQDGGASWTAAAIGANLSGALTKPVRLRATLTTPDTALTPTLVAFTLRYSVSAEILWLSGMYPWLLFALVAVPIAWLLVRRLRTKPFRPTDLYLIHGDGRLVARAGGEIGAVQDELAASGMFTLVARFVRDSFGGSSGPGDLKRMTVDRSEVAIDKGAFLFFALVYEGAAPDDLNRRMSEFLGAIEEAWGPVLREWDGLRDEFGDLEPQLAWYLQTGYLVAHPGLSRLAPLTM
ncbi:MAG TPA: DNRLRE domain-containing protein [Thermoplasmata archaeon]